MSVYFDDNYICYGLILQVCDNITPTVIYKFNNYM